MAADPPDPHGGQRWRLRTRGTRSWLTTNEESAIGTERGRAEEAQDSPRAVLVSVGRPEADRSSFEVEPPQTTTLDVPQRTLAEKVLCADCFSDG